MATLMEKDVLIEARALALANYFSILNYAEKKGLGEKYKTIFEPLETILADLKYKYYSTDFELLNYELETAHLKSINTLLTAFLKILKL